MLKSGGEQVQDALLKLFNLYMKYQKSPGVLWKAQVMMLYKHHGDVNDYNNYRGISFISCVAKLYEYIVYQRLLQEVQPKLQQQQAGFRQKRDCMQNIFLVQECAHYRHIFEHKPTYLLFCDLAKAYDTVW